MEGRDEALDQLRVIFDLCDSDKDGFISVDDFRRLGSEHFDKTQPMEVLIEQIDPQGAGHITFAMFRAGIETFLTMYPGAPRSRSTSQSSSHTDGFDSLPAVNSLSAEEVQPREAVYPCSATMFSSFTNGYTSDSSSRYSHHILTHSLSGEGEADPASEPLTHSSPVACRRHTFSTFRDRDSPSLINRLKVSQYNQLGVPSPGSQTSTPAEQEVDEMVSQMSDQLSDLSSKLENLEEDQKSSHGHRDRLRKEREELRARLEEYEDHIHSTEEAAQRLLRESQDRHMTSISRIRRQSQVQLDDVNAQLLVSKEEVNRIKLSETSLHSRLETVEEQLQQREGRVSGLEERLRAVQGELSSTTEQLRTDRDKWEREKESCIQAVEERDQQVAQLQRTCEEVKKEKNRRSIAASDMDNEVSRLTQEVERLKRDNTQLQAQFLLKGQQLMAQSVQSLADEMEDASKDEVMKALRDTEQLNARLHDYIDGLLVNIIDKYPELLERR